MSIGQRWDRYWFAPQSPFNLGVCRALFFGLTFVLYFHTPIAPLAEVPDTSPFWDPVWLLGRLDRVLRVAHLSIVAPPAAMSAIGWAWKLSLLLACLGLFTRVSTWVALILGTYILGLFNSYGKIEHDALPAVFLLAILAISRCGDAFSLDSQLRPSRTKKAPILPSGEYRWPIRAACLVLALLFFDAGTAKLRRSGFDWAWGDGFGLLLITKFYDPNPPFNRIGLFIANHIWLSRFMATGSLIVETFFPLALFTRWGRWFFPAAALSMQIGIGIVMNIWFIQFLGAYVFWVPWDRVLGRAARVADPLAALHKSGLTTEARRHGENNEDVAL